LARCSFFSLCAVEPNLVYWCLRPLRRLYFRGGQSTNAGGLHGFECKKSQAANRWPALYLVPNVIYVVVLAAYVVLLFFGPGIDTLHGLEAQAMGQKIIVYTSIINVCIQAYGIRRFLRGEIRADEEPQPAWRRSPGVRESSCDALPARCII
jgi:hypothetical protein